MASLQYITLVTLHRLIRVLGDGVRQPMIIALTVSVTAEARRACADAGMDQYLSKPFRFEELAEARTLTSRVPVPVPVPVLAPVPSPEPDLAADLPTTPVAEKAPVLDPELFGYLDEMGAETKAPARLEAAIAEVTAVLAPHLAATLDAR
ncbi:hypothetical protein [Cryobacterium sp. GrIS_2_6]|uniref:hypothetical protein n=1 Tax=Cryobacterium sp. GrIS_2_6 TaxID=3162785 RepID=UPI002E037A15|nr:CheY-like chemotaxis protein [Cryobacterium psychrotolerans]